MDKGDKMRTKIVAAISRYTAENGFSPSIREIAAMVGIRSASHARYHLNFLVDCGILTYTPNIHRSIKILEAQK